MGGAQIALSLADNRYVAPPPSSAIKLIQAACAERPQPPLAALFPAAYLRPPFFPILQLLLVPCTSAHLLLPLTYASAHILHLKLIDICAHFAPEPHRLDSLLEAAFVHKARAHSLQLNLYTQHTSGSNVCGVYVAIMSPTFSKLLQAQALSAFHLACVKSSVIL